MISILFQCLKEFVAVLFQLLCYARMGNYDFFNGPLILFVTLTVFGFPFLNSNLFALLRFGPWNKDSEFTVFGKLFQVMSLAGCQIAGAAAAAGAWYNIVGRWKMLGEAIENGILYTNSSVHGAVYNSLDSNVEVDTTLAQFSIFMDEFAAQAIFFIGLIHIMEVTLPGLLTSAAWNASGIAPPSSKPKHTPVPLYFILCVCVLVAGVTRAFPSAHQSPHISVYLLVTRSLGTEGIDVKACWLRIGGGIASLVLALPYYWFVYMDRPEEGGGKWGNTLKKVLMDEAPAYMRSELLLPGVFKP